MADTQNAASIAELIAGVLGPRDDIATATVNGARVRIQTQASEVFEVTVTEEWRTE
jgi:hypothetical protein